MPPHPSKPRSPRRDRGRSPERRRAATPSASTAITLSPAQPATGSGATDGEAFAVGQLVEVERFPKSWYVATIREADGAQLLVHYEGWSSRWDESVPLRKAQPIDGDQATARLLQQKRTRSPSPGPRTRPDSEASSPVTTLSQLINLGDIVGKAPEIFTEVADRNSAALIVMNQVGDPTVSVSSTTAADHVLAVERGRELLAAARQAHVHVVHITFGCYTVDGSDLEFMKQRAIGDDRSRLQEQSAPREYTPAPGEAVLQTSTSSAFASTGLEQILKNMHVVYPIFIGSFTDGCLGLTASDSISRGFLPTVVSDAALGSSKVSHLAMLRMFDQHWGRVRTSAEQSAEFSDSRAPEVAAHLSFPRKPRLAPAHMSPRAERAAQRHTRNAAVMVQAHWRGNRARVAYRAQRGAQAAAEAPAPSPPLADAAAEEEPAVLSVSMTKSAAGFGLGFIMEDIVLVNRVDPGGQAQVAGVQEGDVLAELQGVTIEGAESFAAAQQLVKSAAMGSVVSWVFQAHAEEEVSALLEEEEEEEQPVLDLGTVGLSELRESVKAAIEDQEPSPVVRRLRAQPKPAPAEVTAVVEVEAVAQPKKLRDRRATAALPSTKSATEDTPVKERRSRGGWRKLYYLDEDAPAGQQEIAIGTREEAQELIRSGVVVPNTLVWKKSFPEWEHLEDVIDQLPGLSLA